VRDVYGDHRMFERPESRFFFVTVIRPQAGREVVDTVGARFTICVRRYYIFFTGTVASGNGSSGLVRDDSADCAAILGRSKRRPGNRNQKRGICFLGTSIYWLAIQDTFTWTYLAKSECQQKKCKALGMYTHLTGI